MPNGKALFLLRRGIATRSSVREFARIRERKMLAESYMCIRARTLVGWPGNFAVLHRHTARCGGGNLAKAQAHI